MAETETDRTPLQQKLDEFGEQLSKVLFTFFLLIDFFEILIKSENLLLFKFQHHLFRQTYTLGSNFLSGKSSRLFQLSV